MYIMSFVTAALFIFFAVLLLNGKGAFLIAGYNTMDKEKQKNYDEKAMCRFMGKAMLMLALGIILWGLSSLYHQTILFILGIVIFFSTIIVILIYSNTKNRFIKKD